MVSSRTPIPGKADHIDNIDGTQAAYLFAVPDTGLYLEGDPGLAEPSRSGSLLGTPSR